MLTLCAFTTSYRAGSVHPAFFVRKAVMAEIEARRITKNYTIGNRQISVLNNVSLSVAGGEFIVIAGTSGSGKTTLLSLLSGLDKPSSGRVLLAEQDITDTAEDDLAPLRNEIIGFVFQSFHLVPSLTALENVMFPAELKHDPQARTKADDLLRRVGMQKRCDNYPHQLSGGEMQRVAMCRAIINNPRIIFADEPTGNLDSENGRAVLDLMLEFQKESQTTLVLVTHSLEIAKMADRVIVLKDGRITRTQQTNAGG
jgi:putative ABC transport system ATP-binding protein